MMFFVLMLVLAVVFGVVALFAKNQEKSGLAEYKFLFSVGKYALSTASVVIALYAVLSTSVVWVSSGEFATLKRVYGGRSLPPGQIVALNGELGPQARIITAGFHIEFLVNLLNDIDYVPVFTVPNGKCAIMSAKDGVPNQGGSAFADPWPDATKKDMANNAVFFLTEGKGQRGPQTTVLTPSMYTIHPFLWETPRLIDATRVEQGTVGVVKSSVHAAVDFGSFKREAPKTNELRVLTKEVLPKNAAGALLVPVGAVGVWEEPLPNNLYYINTEAYLITMVPTVAQVEEYKGGYKRRTIDISVDVKGQIIETVTDIEVQQTPDTADIAVFTKPEGWDVPQELRVIAQVDPHMAPFVVASLGLTATNAASIIENRVVTPIIRSVTREVLGGSEILFSSKKALYRDGKPEFDENGDLKTTLVSEFRAVKVLDLLENRSSIEAAIEERAKPEALKEGVTINEVRLAESAIPAALLIARKREQLAQQLTVAWAQEEVAQVQRQKTENARSQADQQAELVKAEIFAKAAKERANARKTEGEGEEAYLTAIAIGQKTQAEVLGQETTARLQMFRQALQALTEIADKNPAILTSALSNAHKFVPQVVVSGDSNGVEGAAAVFGHLMNSSSRQKSEPNPNHVSTENQK